MPNKPIILVEPFLEGIDGKPVLPYTGGYWWTVGDKIDENRPSKPLEKIEAVLGHGVEVIDIVPVTSKDDLTADNIASYLDPGNRDRVEAVQITLLKMMQAGKLHLVVLLGEKRQA